MTLQPYEEPRANVTSAEQLSLSGPALVDLMTAVLARGAPFRFSAKGWSMDPFIRNGDVITISPLRGRAAGVGDVIAFVSPTLDKLVVHRVIAREGDSVVTQGDGIPEGPDGTVSAEAVLGRVTKVERSGKDVSLGLGLERGAIAWASRRRLLVPMRMQWSRWRRRLNRQRG